MRIAEYRCKQKKVEALQYNYWIKITKNENFLRDGNRGLGGGAVPPRPEVESEKTPLHSDLLVAHSFTFIL